MYIDGRVVIHFSLMKRFCLSLVISLLSYSPRLPSSLLCQAHGSPTQIPLPTIEPAGIDTITPKGILKHCMECNQHKFW